MEHTVPRKRPRPRPVVSCLRCREKKLKCDRTCPCQNCIKAGCREECAYNTRMHADESQGSNPRRLRVPSDVDNINSRPTSHHEVGVVEDLQQRVTRLEELLAVRSDASDPRPICATHTGVSRVHHNSAFLALPYPGTLAVKGSRSRYHGENSRISLLNQFPDAKEFINRCTEDAELVGLAREVQSLQARSTAPVASPDSLPESAGLPELHYLGRRLPPKSTCDKMLRVYTTLFEGILRVIHRPSFHRQYQKFWDHYEQQNCSEFVPLLTAVLAAAALFNPDAFTSEEYSAREYFTHEATRALHAWVNQISRKQRNDLATLQVETLVLLSEYLQLTPVDEMWQASGSLVRSGMTMGLHVDLSRFTKLSFYQKECRRRLWVTILELDLQISIVSGMPMMAPEMDLGPLTPLNLNDTDFDESTSEPPVAAEIEEETDSLAQVTLATSLAHRMKMMRLAQYTSARDSLGERIELSTKLEEYLTRMPHQLKPGNEKSTTRPASIMSNVLLDVFIRRPLLHLLRPCLSAVTNAGLDEPSFLLIRRACLYSSLAIISYQDYFDPLYAESDTQDVISCWNFFYSHCHNDLLWSVLSLCEFLRTQNHTSTVSSSLNNTVDSGRGDGQVPSKASLIRLLDGTLDTFIRQSHRRGSNVKDILLLTAVIQSIRSRAPTEQRQQRMLQGAKDTMVACRRNLVSMASLRTNSGNIGAEEQISPHENLPNFAGISAYSLSTPHPQNSDFTQVPLESTANFEDLVSDLFSFDDSSFMWNL
ncbi:hypothetical protein N7539_007592 [Penicillium diatomitis]|uniref:Zn(2)-C6 fungal-type domain-containing protein n=1 Tax=Penicillium diatomitis TaxID=2819901 RepID=A0A9W9WVG2_9EURO|nr:uncharacterized protein N7539_007592 [Penicillium diatomitis]KAJ5477448.1 hypothetical protein N7539_007592 [Penicillium diatomitis]